MGKIYLSKLVPDSTSILNGVTIHNTEDLPRVEDDGEQYTRATLNDNMGTVRTNANNLSQNQKLHK